MSAAERATESGQRGAQVDMEDAACPFGCARLDRGDRVVVEGFDRLQGMPGRFQVVECAGCGLLRTSPRPTLESMPAYYGAGYQPYLSSRPTRRRGAALTDRLLLAEALPKLPPGRMLEVGCGSGGFLDRMARRGWQVAGIEPSAEPASRCAALGFAVHGGPLETAPDRREELDLVAAWMVVEHLHDPLGGLARLASWTRPGGWLVLSVPNAGAWERRAFGSAWFPLQVPTHLFHFTAATLGRALETAGWEVRRIAYQRSLADVLASCGHVLDDRGRLPALARLLASYPWRGGRFNLALLPLAWPLALLGQTGRMTVWATKRRARA